MFGEFARMMNLDRFAIDLPHAAAPLAAGFVTPAFIAAGAALAAIPIIIHLLNRRRFKTVTWAAMEFLLRAMKKNRRRLRFEQWLLLATRCALLLLLGLAMSRPLGCQNAGLAALGGRSGLTVFILDNSYSMAYEVNRPDAKTHLDQAKKLVTSLIDQLGGGGESVAIVAASRAPADSTAQTRPAQARGQVVFRPGYDLAAAKGAVDRLDQTYLGTDVAGALRAAIDIGREQIHQPNKRLVIVSDSTLSAWKTADADALKQIGVEASKLFEITYHDVTDGKPQWNQGILDLRPADNLVTSRFGTVLQADAKGFGPGPAASVEWRLNEQLIDTTRSPVTLSPDSPAQSLPRSSLPGGPQLITASLAGADPLRIDNARWAVVDVAADLKTLIVEGQRGRRAVESSGFFVREAIAPQQAPPDISSTPTPGAASAAGSYAAPDVISDLELGNKLLTDYTVVVMAGVGDVKAADADRLERFVRQGGALLMFMGDAVSATNYNSVLLPRKLLPGPLVKQVLAGGDKKPFTFDFKPRGVLHPFLEAFRNQENTGLDTTDVYTYWQVEPSIDLGVERILNYLPNSAGGASADAKADPAFTVHRLGDGRVVFCSTSGNNQWTTFPNKNNFPTLLHELLGHTVQTAGRWLNLTVGQPLVVPSTIRLPAPPTLTDAAGKPVVITAALDPTGETFYRTEPIARPGVYTLKLGARTMPVGVNVPGDEADVRTMNSAALRDAMGGVDIAFQGSAAPATAADAREGNDFGWALLAALLALIGVEAFMAMRFGHFRRGTMIGGGDVATVR